jgi:hypothetical protein
MKRVLGRSRLVIIGSLVFTILGTGFGLTPVATASVIPNDPGFCGVRVAGPTLAGVDFTYTMENKCATGYYFKVLLPISGRYATASDGTGGQCEFNPGYGTLTSYYAATADPSWEIQLC